MSKLLSVKVLGICFLLTMVSSGKPTMELEGCFSLDHFDKSIAISVTEKCGLLAQQRVCVAIFGEQTIKNNSFVNDLFGGVDYRFHIKGIQIPVGIFGGFNNLTIGSYSAFIPVAGCNTGCFLFFTDNISLRINYYAKWFFDSRIVFGGDVFVGLGYSTTW